MPSDERISVTINTDPDQSYTPRARCAICQQMINLSGLARSFSHHYFPDTRVMVECEGSGWTPGDVDQILRDRKPVPGRYVRPHP